MTIQQVKALQFILIAVLETIQESGDAPAGIMYAALQAQGCSYIQFTSMMESLEDRGYVTNCNHVYNITDKGNEYLQKIKSNKAA